MDWVLIIVAAGGLAVPEIEHFPSKATCEYAAEHASSMEAWKEGLEWRCYDETKLELSLPQPPD